MNLMELLTVMAIVAILAAALFPAFAAAREKACQTLCVNNLHQIGVALYMYANDWDGCFPGAGHPFGAGLHPGNAWMAFDAGTLWCVNLAAYLPDPLTFKDPCKSGFAANWNSDWSQWQINGTWVPDTWKNASVSYGVNDLLMLSTHPKMNATDAAGGAWFHAPDNNYLPNSGYGGTNLKLIKNTHECISISDAASPQENCYDKCNITAVCGWATPDCDLGTAYEAPGAPALYPAHVGGNNWLFVDGSVSWHNMGQYRCQETPAQVIDPNVGGSMISNDPNAPEYMASLNKYSLQHIHGIDQIDGLQMP